MTDDNRELDAARETFSRVISDPAGYFARAQARAALRRSPAQFGVIVLAFCFMGLFSWLLGSFLHWLHWYPDRATVGTRTAAAEYLMYLPSLFTSIAPGGLLANFVTRFIPPWRRVLDREAARVRGTDYASSQRGLARGALIVFAVTLPFQLAGVLLGR